jgi:hypothetical protein
MRKPVVIVIALGAVLTLGAWAGSRFLPAASAAATNGSAAPCNAAPASTRGVVFCEDFNGDAQARWNIGSHGNVWPASQFVMCGDGVGFHDRCAAWSNYLLFDNEWGFYGYDSRRSFPPQSDFYVRWYQYISDPFVWGSLEDKSVLLHDQAETITVILGTNRNHLPAERNSGPGMPYIANYQDLDWKETDGRLTHINRFQNQGRNVALKPGTWYLFEWHVKLNTPGIADGLSELWVDDASAPVSQQTLRMRYTDMRWLRTADAGKRFGLLRLTVYDQRCDSAINTCPPRGPATLTQFHRWDQIVVSTAPIGPVK